MNQQIYDQAKKCKSIEELSALAEENNIELTKEQVKEYYDKLQPPIGELSDDELDAVAGGGCGSSGALYHTGDHVMLKSNLFCNRAYSFYQGAQYRTEIVVLLIGRLREKEKKEAALFICFSRLRVVLSNLPIHAGVHNVVSVDMSMSMKSR